MQSDTKISTALDNLKEVRSKKREAVLQLGRLVEEAVNELKSAIHEKPLLDPITRQPLMLVQGESNERGFSLVVTALKDKYAFTLETHYEHGGILVSGARSRAQSRQEFYDLVFGGTPIRLVRGSGGRLDLVRRTTNGNEEPIPIINILGRFIAAVSRDEVLG
jgi:hypothetical protein